MERSARARAGARLPQRAGFGRRPDRHDRPGDGLRHDRHRARLRAGEVQEARRRRLFQDHQPRRARRAQDARLRRKEDRGHRRLRRRPRDARERAGRQPRIAPCEGLSGRGDGKGRGGAAERVRHPLRVQQVDARRRDADPRSEDFGRALRRAGLRSARRARLLEGGDRGRQHFRLRRHDVGGRASPQGRALRGVRLRQSLRPHRQALSLGREPHPHDGGGAALHLGRDLQDHQHAERRHGRGLQGRLHAELAARPQGQRPLPRRLEAVAAAEQPADRERRRGGGGARDAASPPPPRPARRRSRKRSSSG